MNPYLPKNARIIGKWNETEDTSTFRVKFPSSHEPGQFAEVGIMGIGEAPISICSHSSKFMDLCIRDVGNVTKHLTSKTKGDAVSIRGPYGNGYPMQDIIGNDVVFVGGGTGVAPLRGALEYIMQKRNRFFDVSLFLGYRSPKDILFKRDLDKWKETFDLNLTVDQADKSWKGLKGVVTAPLEKAKLNPDTKAILCGPPIMIKFVLQTLLKKGLKEENIYTSYERLMHCGIGKCGHCMVSGKYICKDGPVFRYDTSKNMFD